MVAGGDAHADDHGTARKVRLYPPLSATLHLSSFYNVLSLIRRVTPHFCAG
jgi:hypothetical protein